MKTRESKIYYSTMQLNPLTAGAVHIQQDLKFVDLHFVKSE